MVPLRSGSRDFSDSRHSFSQVIGCPSTIDSERITDIPTFFVTHKLLLRYGGVALLAKANASQLLIVLDNRTLIHMTYQLFDHIVTVNLPRELINKK